MSVATPLLLLTLGALLADNRALRRERARLRAAMRRVGAELLVAGLTQERAEAVLGARLAAVWRTPRIDDGESPAYLVDSLEGRLN